MASFKSACFRNYLLCTVHPDDRCIPRCSHLATDIFTSARKSNEVSRYYVRHVLSSRHLSPALVQSDVLTLTYNLPDPFSIQAMNWTYVAHELDVENMVILQKLVSLSLGTA